MNLYLLLRLLHIASAIAFVGGLFARQMVRSLLPRAADIPSLEALMAGAGVVERSMVIPGNLLAILFGAILALTTRAPILGAVQGASSNWLFVSVLIVLLLFPLVPLVFLPRGRAFATALQSARAAGQVTPDLRRFMADPVVRWAHAAELVGVSIIVVLMVFKPF
jgi:uncharacterized membrane protein